MVLSLSELQELVMDREALRAVIHGVAESDKTERLNWTELNAPLNGTRVTPLISHFPRFLVLAQGRQSLCPCPFSLSVEGQCGPFLSPLIVPASTGGVWAGGGGVSRLQFFPTATPLGEGPGSSWGQWWETPLPSCLSHICPCYFARTHWLLSSSWFSLCIRFCQNPRNRGEELTCHPHPHLSLWFEP